MLYSFTVTVPAETPRSEPIEQKVALTAGVVDQLMVHFPAGCAGLVGLRVLRGSFQIWPLVTDEWFVSDDHTIIFPDNLPLTPGTDVLSIEAYNEDTVNDHALTVSFSVNIPTEDMMWLVVEKLDQLLAKDISLPAKQLRELLQTMGEIRGELFTIRNDLLPTTIDFLYAILEQLEATKQGVSSLA